MVAWHNKMQNSISPSTAEDEYIIIGSGYTQLMWMKQMLLDYGFRQNIMSLFIDNTSVIEISKNPIQHSKTKNIDISHHFIRELVEDKIISLEYFETKTNLQHFYQTP